MAMKKNAPLLLLLVSVAAAFSVLYSPFISRPQREPGLSINNGAAPHCDYSSGSWILDQSKRPLYSEDCPFHRNAWNCLRSKRPGMDRISAWRWVPTGQQCPLPAVPDPAAFLSSMRNKRFGFIGDSLNENFMVSMLCILHTADPLARKWKRKGAWRGAFFPSYNVTVGYHRAVLLARYNELQPSSFPVELKAGKAYRVDVDVPAPDWANVLQFYDVFIFNTGHWWNSDKFPSESPLVFYEGGKPVLPLMGMKQGLSAVLKNMIQHVERGVPSSALKIWRMQSPRHFEGGDWNQNGSCTSDSLLTHTQAGEWFLPENGGVNKEARELNRVIEQELRGKKFEVLNITPMSELRRDAHPAVWLGKKDAHLVWGQDCLHWCLPGLPDTWVGILFQMTFKFYS